MAVNCKKVGHYKSTTYLYGGTLKLQQRKTACRLISSTSIIAICFYDSAKSCYTDKPVLEWFTTFLPHIAICYLFGMSFPFLRLPNKTHSRCYAIRHCIYYTNCLFYALYRICHQYNVHIPAPLETDRNYFSS